MTWLVFAKWRFAKQESEEWKFSIEKENVMQVEYQRTETN